MESCLMYKRLFMPTIAFIFSWLKKYQTAFVICFTVVFCSFSLSLFTRPCLPAGLAVDDTQTCVGIEAAAEERTAGYLVTAVGLISVAAILLKRIAIFLSTKILSFAFKSVKVVRVFCESLTQFPVLSSGLLQSKSANLRL